MFWIERWYLGGKMSYFGKGSGILWEERSRFGGEKWHFGEKMSYSWEKTGILERKRHCCEREVIFQGKKGGVLAEKMSFI